MFFCPGSENLQHPDYFYLSIVYSNPQAPQQIVSITRLLVDGKPDRAETVGVWAMSYMGPVPVMIFDRYHNTDLWYVWEWDKFKEQHPEEDTSAQADPDRQQRQDAI